MNTSKILLFFLMVIGCLTLAVPKFDVGLCGGTMFPNHDLLATQTFASNFYWQGVIGFVDDSGWEARGELGWYRDTSHYSLSDIAKNLRINVKPLCASLIYNFRGGIIQPYVGIGVGGYFYDILDDIYSYESGFKLGGHLLGGIRLRVSDTFYLAAEYCQRYVPQVFFPSEQNFDLATITLGGLFEFPMQIESAEGQSASYKYTREQEDLLIQIEQVQTEMTELKTKQDRLEARVDAFYEKNDLDENSAEFAAELRKIKYWELKIKDIDEKILLAKKELKDLQDQWLKIRRDNEPVE
ncbi:MAG: hypothetical protein AABZ14_00020, partial [Candidatus Margulisiibacteriota bacterium]